MFWLVTARRSANPRPPMPTPAMFSLSLGGVRRPPSTWGCATVKVARADEAAPRRISEADDPRYPTAPEGGFFYSEEDLDAIVRRLEALGYVH